LTAARISPEKSEDYPPERHYWPPQESATCLTREIIHELLTAEANNCMNSSEPAQFEAMSRIRTAASELKFGDIEKQAGHFVDTSEDGLRAVSAPRTSWIPRFGCVSNQSEDSSSSLFFSCLI
jgi:hypothetical protein